MNRRSWLKTVAMVGSVTLVSSWATTASAAANEIVKFRLTSVRRIHSHNAEEAKSFAMTLKKIGCECQVDKHGGHFDVVYQCPKWKQIKAQSHEEAHKWEAWLKKAGFETVHEH